MIPYAHCGYAVISDPESGFFGDLVDRNIGAGPGILLTAKVGNRLSITADARDLMVSERFHSESKGGVGNIISASIGLSFTFGQNGWERCPCASAASRADAEAALSAAQAAVAEN